MQIYLRIDLLVTTHFEDFVRLKNRFNVETDSSLMGLPNQKTLQAMRLLSATPNSVLCAKLTHALYKVCLVVVFCCWYTPMKLCDFQISGVMVVLVTLGLLDGRG